jgi:hypothetical protein
MYVKGEIGMGPWTDDLIATSKQRVIMDMVGNCHQSLTPHNITNYLSHLEIQTLSWYRHQK